MVEKKTIELVDKDTLSADIGDKSQLDTVDKSNLVNAINEVKSEVGNVDLSSCAKAVDVGDKNNLQTNNKNDLVAAINEIKGKADEAFQSGNDAKQGLVDALVAKDIEASTSETWDSLNNKVNDIKTLPGWFNKQKGYMISKIKFTKLPSDYVAGNGRIIKRNNIYSMFQVDNSKNKQRLIVDYDDLLDTYTTRLHGHVYIDGNGISGYDKDHNLFYGTDNERILSCIDLNLNTSTTLINSLPDRLHVDSVYSNEGYVYIVKGFETQTNGAIFKYDILNKTVTTEFTFTFEYLPTFTGTMYMWGDKIVGVQNYTSGRGTNYIWCCDIINKTQSVIIDLKLSNQYQFATLLEGDKLIMLITGGHPTASTHYIYLADLSALKFEKIYTTTPYREVLSTSASIFLKNNEEMIIFAPNGDYHLISSYFDKNLLNIINPS